ncbi:MAG: hypothetical protein JSV90_02310 [Methanobacteriota archaeon]|nr:MAG: hypothetical protein JSV90_02310 [Euryarchaeota archaeon]
MFCVECGNEGPLIGPLCPDCYSKKHVKATLPEFIDVTVCAHCSSFLIGERWVEMNSIKDAAEHMLRASLATPEGLEVTGVDVKLDEMDDRTFRAAVSADLAAGEHRFRRELSATVRVKQASCNECSKQKGSYFEAIIQVRGDGRALDAVGVEEIQRQVVARVAAIRTGAREVFISRTERVKGGLDFYLSTIQSARIVARELQELYTAEYGESPSLWGRRGGQEVHRVTFLVRLPPFREGDVITCGAKDYLVRGMAKGAVRCLDLRTGEEQRMKHKALEGCALACAGPDIATAVVLVDGDSELQLLDPDTMTPVDVVKPKGFVLKGDNVRLVRTNLGKYALSDDW